MRPASLLLPLATLIGYLATGSFVLRSATTLLCLAIVLIVGIVQVRQRQMVMWWIVVAFALSFAGDFVLGHWGGSFVGFVSGVGLFLLAHLGYVGYSLRLGRLPWLLFTVLVLVFGGYYIVLLRPAIGDAVTRVAVIAYIFVSCLSMAAAVGIGRGQPSVNLFSRVLYIIGIGSLLFSDLLIAQKRFLHDGTLYALMMPTYFASQILVTASVINLKLQSGTLKRLASIVVAVLFVSPLSAEETESVPDPTLSARDHLSLAAYATVGYMTSVAGLSETYLHSHTTAFYDLRLRYQTRPEDGSYYDALFRYPVLQAGIAVGDLTHIDLYRESRHRDYRSTLGCAIAPYFGFHRDIFRSRRWSLGYDLVNGVAICTKPYDAVTNADNEFIGAHLSLFLGIDVEARYRVASQWTLSAAFDFKHLSAASLVRPNLGVNCFGPKIGVTYDLVDQSSLSASLQQGRAEALSQVPDRGRSFYFELSAALIPKALPDEYNYLVAQHVPDPSECPVYLAYNTMFSAMYRYLPHHASGIEADYTYVSFTDRLQELDAQLHQDVIDGRQLHYSPHVAGLGLRHDIFYRHFTINLGLGVYLHRQQGWRAETQESRLYQLVGLRYNFPFTRDHLFVGYTIKAHRFSKVDGLHLCLGYRFGKTSFK